MNMAANRNGQLCGLRTWCCGAKKEWLEWPGVWLLAADVLLLPNIYFSEMDYFCYSIVVCSYDYFLLLTIGWW